MSENEKDDKNFEFIKEQVIEKKRKKIKKWLLPLVTTIFMAVLFGIIAAVTFVIAEPSFSKLLSEEEEHKTPVNFPTKYPEDQKDSNDPTTTKDKENEDKDSEEKEEKIPEPVIVEKTIEADLLDYINIYDDIRSVAYETNKSIVNISSIISGTDIFLNPIERSVKTTGLIIGDNSEDLLILVSLDRVKDASSIKIAFTDTVLVDAILQSYESEMNLAVIAVPLKDIPDIYKNSIQICNLGESYTITVGSPVLALGSPNGHPNSMELGIVTSRGSSISITDNKLDLFNTDIDDNKNSDGIIVNMKGEVIGIMTRTLKEDVNKELNTVIGISKLKIIFDRLANRKPIVYFGIKAEDMTEAARLEHNVSNGIYVNEVQTNSPAFVAGVKNGDIILQVNDQSIINTSNFFSTISGFQPEEAITVKIKRTSGSTEKELDLIVTLLEKTK